MALVPQGGTATGGAWRWLFSGFRRPVIVFDQPGCASQLGCVANFQEIAAKVAALEFHNPNFILMSLIGDMLTKSASGHFFPLVVARRLCYIALMNIVSVTDLAASVRQARRKLGWTQAELAERSGVSRDWIIGLERAKPSQEIALVLRTLKALNLNVSLGSQEERTSTQKAPFPSHAASVVNLDDLLNADAGEGKTR